MPFLAESRGIGQGEVVGLPTKEGLAVPRRPWLGGMAQGLQAAGHLLH